MTHREPMDTDPPTQKLRTLTTGTGHLSSSIAKLSGSSRGIPSNKDFHFYYNFDEFKLPVKQIAAKSHSILQTIGSKATPYPDDNNDAYDWLVNTNDDVYEKFDTSLDEFKRIRKKEEETGVRVVGPDNDGFQLVAGKKKKEVEVGGREDRGLVGAKAKVPFHIATIPRPQDEYKILVNNSNQPFDHVWLQRSEDGSRFIHPLEKFSVFDFVDTSVGCAEPIKPPPIECTPFKLVEEVKDLKELAAKLHGVDEFAVDLEHNQYRSFQGLTCLMQISTRAEDFVVDTLKLRIHIGPYLRDVFKDPKKKKRKEKEEENGFPWFEETDGNQIIDEDVWKYLNGIFLEERERSPMVAVIQARVQGADLNSQQLAIVSGLCEWRDVVARAEDESTGYILPNKTLLEIAKQMPVTASKLRRVLKSKHPYIERNLSSVVSIIRHSIQNAAAFEAAAEQLKEARKESESAGNIVVDVGPEALPPLETPASLETVTGAGDACYTDGFSGHRPAFLQFKDGSLVPGIDAAGLCKGSSGPSGDNGNVKREAGSHIAPTSGEMRDTENRMNVSNSGKEEIKLEKIKSSVNLPFHSFSGRDETLQPVVREHAKPSDSLHQEDRAAKLATKTNSEAVMSLDSDSDVEKSVTGELNSDCGESHPKEDNTAGPALDMDDEDEPMTLSDLSSSFQKCFKSPQQTRGAKQLEKCDDILELTPFDYEAAMKQVRFGEDRGGKVREGGGEDHISRHGRGKRKEDSVVDQSQKGVGAGDFSQGRRRQAFPATGNRSATFR
ncbi:hypothetical protein RJ640_023390 [Escallonia rubra]|uniref:HRDC domain-containing protein n=1 Tax=Escallonia rubra TaxID=112253 RepID=A0AA88UH36_9ASTE|nr:hypothetical protein RJ640_023390 [Escallonia rubra]